MLGMLIVLVDVEHNSFRHSAQHPGLPDRQSVNRAQRRDPPRTNFAPGLADRRPARLRFELQQTPRDRAIRGRGAARGDPARALLAPELLHGVPSHGGLEREHLRRELLRCRGGVDRGDSAFYSMPSCRFRKLNSCVSMVQSAEDRMRNNAYEPLDWACAGRILPERNVNSYFIVIGNQRRNRPLAFSTPPFCHDA